MNPAALPDAALQLPADRLGQADVSITDNELDARKATLLEGGDEFAPEALGLAVAHLHAQQLAAAVGKDAQGDDDGF